MVSKADVTLPQATPEVAEVVEVASLSGTVRGMVSIAVEEEDLRLFLSDPDLDSRLLLLLSLLLVLPSFDMVMEKLREGRRMENVFAAKLVRNAVGRRQALGEFR